MIQANKSKPKAKKAAAKIATVSAVAAGAAAPRKRAAAKAPAKAEAKAPIAAASVTPEERMKMIEQAAYFRAEKSGFTGDPHAHWVAAEAEVDALLKGKAKKGAKAKK